MCYSTTTTIASTGGPTAVVVTPTNATCGADNGTLTIGAVTGGTAPYTYSVDGGAYTNTVITITLAAGLTHIEVTDANGCVYSTTTTIASTGGPTAVVVTPTDATCGADNGTSPSAL